MISTNYAATSALRSLAGGDLKPQRSPLGIELWATVLGEVCGYGLLAHTRIQWWPWEGAKWTVVAVATTSAVAGIRLTMVWAMRGTKGAVDGRVRLEGVR